MRYTTADGLGAVHLAVMHNHPQILKTILQADRTLLCMESENSEESAMVIHLAVMRDNLTIIRYLLNTPSYFYLDEEGNETRRI